MLCEWMWTRVAAMSRTRLDDTASVPDDRREASRWLQNATVEYIRPIMKESSLLRRLYDEMTPNESDVVHGTGDWKRKAFPILTTPQTRSTCHASVASKSDVVPVCESFNRGIGSSGCDA